MSRFTRITILFLLPAFLWAQTSLTGIIRGSVTDAQGGPLIGASIRVNLPDGSHAKTVFAGDEGQYQIGFLRPGRYQVRVSFSGFSTHDIEGVVVHAGEITPVSVMLKPEAVSEAMVVTADSHAIDKSTQNINSYLSEGERELLPVSRTATDLLEFTAGARPGQVWGGSTDQANNFQFDGVSVNSPGFGGSFLLPNVNWIEEFQVKGLGAGAEHGNFQGGLVNIVTKSGSNTQKGNFQVLYEGAASNSSNLIPGEEGAELDRFFEVNADISGAFIKDKLYYFISAEQISSDVNVVDIDQSDQEIVFLDTQEERTETKLFSKITWQLNSADTLNFVLGWDDVETEYRGLDSFTRPEATTTQDSPAVFWNLGWERPFGDVLFMEAKYTGYDGSNDFNPRQGGDLPGVQILGGNRDLGRNAPYTRTRDLDNNAFSLNFDSFFATGSVSHHLKFGGEMQVGNWLETRTRNGNLTWRPEEGDDPFDFDDPGTWGFISSDWGGDIYLDAESTQSSLYVQDYLALNQWLSIGLGARFGQWTGEITPKNGRSFEAVDDSAIAPRIGATVDLANNGEWIAKIHWGQYFQNMFALLYDRVAGGHVFQDTEFWDWDGEGLPDINRSYSTTERDDQFVFFDSNPASDEVGPALNYSQPYVEQLVISLEKEFGPDWMAGVTYVRRENHDIVSLVDLNQDTNYTAFHNVEVIDFRSGAPVLDQFGNPLTLPTVYISNADILDRGWAPGLTDEQVEALTFDQQFALTNADDASREMDQIQTKLDYRGHRIQASFSATYTDLEGNFYSVSGYDDPNGIGAGPYVNPNERINAYGRLRNNAEWSTKLRFTYRLPGEFRLGLFGQWDSGDFYTPYYAIDRRNHDFVAENGETFSPRHFVGVNGESIYLEERGSREHDAFSRMDVHLDKSFSLGRAEWIVGVDAFNLFNQDAATFVRTEVNNQDASDPSTLFGAVRARQEPRSVRFLSTFRW
ncbi:MAG: TonB-dependent receptor [Acidobacteria bacterium]|nr:TonB-dependent receptor [Acidobacteriota bacterium]